MDGRQTPLRFGAPLRLLLTVALALSASVAPRGGEILDRVLAVVAGQVVTLSDARAVLEFRFVEPGPGADRIAEAVEFLVNRELALSEVNRYSAPSADPAVLRERLAALRAQFPGDAGYRQALARTALTDTRLRDLVGDNIRIENYLDQRFSAAAQPTSEEVERYYLDHPADFTRDGTLRPLEEVQAQAFDRLMTERRNSLIADWLDRLRRRFPVSVLYLPQPG